MDKPWNTNWAFDASSSDSESTSSSTSSSGSSSDSSSSTTTTSGTPSISESKKVTELELPVRTEKRTPFLVTRKTNEASAFFVFFL